MEDTIVAIASAYGEAGIGIVRISGEESFRIFKAIFKTSGEIEDRKFNYGHIVDPDSKKVLDEVMAVYLKAPRTYTREDVVEIDCHGGIVPLKKILQLVIRMGARMAERGEFTKRAFLNGRLDLSEAEAVIDLIKSKSEKGFELAQRQANGYISRKIVALREKIMDLLVDITVNIDYPDEDIEEITYAKLVNSLREIKESIEEFRASGRTGKILKEGLNVVIIGKPNVGKSSLLNLLMKEDKAIVTDIAGTTRDTIEASISISGIPVNLVDTAGMRQTDDEIEKIGILKTKEAMDNADLVILMMDACKELDEQDFEMIEALYGRKGVIFFNKIDLPEAKLEHKEEVFKKIIKIYGTIKLDKGIKQLEDYIKDMVYDGKIDMDDSEFVSSVRHIELLEKASLAISDAIKAAEMGEALDFVEVDVKNAYDYLGDIVGENVTGDVINEVFSRFCLGK